MNCLLVIDGDNISSNTFSTGWSVIDKNIITEKVLYGDFTKSEMVKWHKFAIENNIELFHCPRNNKKQTTDLNIFINVMTKLYENNFDELFIVTNDSDFILLANAWIKKNKKVTFYSSNNCSKLIKNNFPVIILENKTINNINKENKTTKNINKDNKTTKNIKVKLLEFLENNNETCIKDIQNNLENYYGKVKSKRVKKLLEKIDSNYLWIQENKNNFEDSYVLYYPKLLKIKQKNKNVKKLKTLLKKINLVYPNFSKFINLKSIDDI